jgi:hypothetical protein
MGVGSLRWLTARSSLPVCLVHLRTRPKINGPSTEDTEAANLEVCAEDRHRVETRLSRNRSCHVTCGASTSAKRSPPVGGTVHPSTRWPVMMGRIVLAVVVAAYFLLIGALGAITKARTPAMLDWPRQDHNAMQRVKEAFP